MAVYLRKKSISGGRKSYYLDIWHGEKRRYEFLKLYQVKARTQEEKEQNQKVKELAESIRAKREIELTSSDYDIIPKFKRNTDFLAYFEHFYTNYQNKDERLVKGAFTHFSIFIQERDLKYLPVKNLDEQICRDFKAYLEDHLNGETIANYFKKFRTVIQKAVREKLIKEDITKEIHIIKSEGLKKAILTFEEIQKLAKAQCGNDQVKRAFLFSCNTGLRFCDVNELRWKDVDLKKAQISYIQAKTRHTSKTANHTLDLNPTALNMIGSKGKPDEKIFTLPSHTGCLQSLKTWAKNAKIEKHITWHCARHSIAVNLLDTGTDVKTVAGILGHSGLAHVDKYLRVIDERKKQAVNRLPEINL